jgi:hypothetical protein
MLVTTYSDARANFASILDRAKKDGAVLIKRADGSLFRLQSEKSSSSPFDGIRAVAKVEAGSVQAALDDLRAARA